MATRRTRRVQTRRKGSGWFSKKARNLGFGFAVGPPTDLLAREILPMIEYNYKLRKAGIKENREEDFNTLLLHHKNVNKGHLIRDLINRGMKDFMQYDILDRINDVLPEKRKKYYDTTTE